LNSKELKSKIESLYLKSLGLKDPHMIVVLDAIKSIIGLNLDNINTGLLNYFIANLEEQQYYDLPITKDYKDIPEVMSMVDLEQSLLDKDSERSFENIYYLSRVSDGLQIMEFLLEFSLKYCSDSYKIIWHMLRMQKFLNNNYMLESLNKSISLILSESFISTVETNDDILIWSDVLSSEFKKIDELLLYYTIYKSDLIRSDALKRLIVSRVFLDYNKSSLTDKNIISVKKNQIDKGRIWISDYINSDEGSIYIANFGILVFLNNIRSCLMLSDNELEKQYFWSYLNKRL
tara:strand:+ start:1613 stop:2482 length:870 start_codon:yes stop_codon:yes gene_type:complete